jgi:hypothetical protein
MQLHPNTPALAWARPIYRSLIAFATSSMFLGLSRWDILYHIIVITVLLTETVGKARAADNDRAQPAPAVRAQPG